MRNILIAIITLLFITPLIVNAGQGIGPGPGCKAYSGGGGGAAWYYPSGVTATSDTASTDSGWLHATYVYGGRIQAGSSGTATAIGIKVSAHADAGIKIGLYDDSNALLAQCETASGTTDAWIGCTISQAVTSGTYYRVFYSSQYDSNGIRYTAGQAGYFGTCAYASAMCNPPTSVGTETNGYGVRVCKGGTCS